MEDVFAHPGSEVVLGVLERLVEDVEVVVQGGNLLVLFEYHLHVTVDVCRILALDHVQIEKPFEIQVSGDSLKPSGLLCEEVLNLNFVFLHCCLVEIAGVQESTVGLGFVLSALADDFVEVLVLLGHKLQILFFILLRED